MFIWMFAPGFWLIVLGVIGLLVIAIKGGRRPLGASLAILGTIALAYVLPEVWRPPIEGVGRGELLNLSFEQVALVLVAVVAVGLGLVMVPRRRLS